MLVFKSIFFLTHISKKWQV